VLSVGNDDDTTANGSSLIDEIVRDGARRMLAAALEAEANAYVAELADQRDENGQRLVVGNGYQGNLDVIMPYRTPANGALTDWHEDRNTIRRKVRASACSTRARMTCWKILRDYRRAAIAHLHNIALAG